MKQLNIMVKDLYSLSRYLYAIAMDLAEEENDIKIASTKNAEVFYSRLKELLVEVITNN